MVIETVALDHLPASYAVHLAFFRNVSNAAFLHSQLLAHNSDFEYAFIDASIVFSRKQLLAAVFRAVTAAANDALKTPNVHAEIVYSFSSSNNIADAYRRYGMSPGSKNILVVKVSVDGQPAGENIDQHLKTHVGGESFPVTDENIAPSTDMAKVSKYYKLNGLAWLDSIKEEGLKRQEMEALILGSMALRGV